MRCSFRADLLVRVEATGEGFTPVDACVHLGSGDRGDIGVLAVDCVADGVTTKGSERSWVENTVLGRDLRRHLRVAWALVVRRTSFPSKNDEVRLATKGELVDLVAELFG